MIYSRWVFILLFACSPQFLPAQADYNTYYVEMRPTRVEQSLEEKLTTLDSFLRVGVANEDTVSIIHGHMYLGTVHYKQGEFKTVMEHFLAAEDYAKQQQNELLLGRINHKKGAVYISLLDYEKAKETFEKALVYHKLARDSQYLAITYDELGYISGCLNNFEQAEDYYNLSIPLVQRHCGPHSLMATYSNYGVILTKQGKRAEAIVQYRKAVEISKEIEDIHQTIPCHVNLAGEYLALDSLEPALKLLQYCAQLSIKNEWSDHMVLSYVALSDAYEKMGNLDSALFYFRAHHHLSDSIIGAGVQTDILEIETARLIREKEEEAIRERILASRQKGISRKLMYGGGFLLLFACAVLFVFYRHRKKSRLAIEGHRTELQILTKELQKKNAELRDQEGKDVSVEEPDHVAVPEFDPYASKILTEKDWLEFKASYERSYPGYLKRVRDAYPAISEAEERLFLLINIKLTNREIADLLGIQSGSVKKTRSRLRKRLELSKETSLDKFIEAFS